MKVREGMRTFRAMKRVWSGRSLTLGVERELYERILVPIVMYGSESWGMRVDERNKLVVAEMNGLRISTEFSSNQYAISMNNQCQPPKIHII